MLESPHKINNEVSNAFIGYGWVCVWVVRQKNVSCATFDSA